MKVKEESEKVSSKLNIQKTKIMASGPITSWQIDEETVETVRDFVFGGSEITVTDYDYRCDYICDYRQMVTTTLKLKDACPLEEKLWPTERAC